MSETVRRRAAVALGLIVLAGYLAACASRPPAAPPLPAPSPGIAAPEPTPTSRRFDATAYTIEGTTKSGGQARQGIVAADPKVLPIGTRIRVTDAGPYSGEYTVADTGRAIKGNEIDIYIANDKEAKRFGRRSVHVEVLSER